MNSIVLTIKTVLKNYKSQQTIALANAVFQMNGFDDLIFFHAERDWKIRVDGTDCIDQAMIDLNSHFR